MTRDAAGSPSAVEVPARDAESTLVLAQNFNDGWSATLDGSPLAAQRVDGWQQGWRLPAGGAAKVTIAYLPERGYAGGLLVGAVGVAVVLLVLVLPAGRGRRAARPPLVAAPAGWIDLALAVVGVGLLTGWVGAGVTLAALLVLPRQRRVDPDSSRSWRAVW